MALLYLSENETTLDEAIDRTLAETGAGARAAVEVGAGHSSIPRLVADASSGAHIGRLGESLLLITLAVREAGDLAPRTALALRAPLLSLRRAGVSPSALRAVAGQIIGDGAQKTRRLAAWLEHYERQLGERRDSAAVERDALAALTRAPIANLREVDAVELAAPPEGPLARAVLDALLARGLSVRCRIAEIAPAAQSAPGVAAIHAERVTKAAIDTLAALEASGGSVELLPVPLAAGPAAEVVNAGSPSLEAREVARRVRDHVFAGHAPDDVVVVADDRARRALLADAIRRYEVPVEVLADAHALEAEAVRVVPMLLELADEGVPRDRLVDLLSSRYVEGGVAPGELARGISAGRVTRALREVVPASARAADYPSALALWSSSDDLRRRLIAGHVLEVVAALGLLPSAATIARHIHALRQLLDRLQLFTRTRRLALASPPSAGTRAAEALKRDQAGLRRLEDLLDALPRAAAQAGLANRPFSRLELGALLREELTAASLTQGGGRGGVVQVCASRDLVPRKGVFLILAAAEEGSLPVAGRDHPFVPDDLCFILERALDRKIFATARERERGAVLRLARARAQAARLCVTHARATADGRPLFVGALAAHAEASARLVHRAPLSPIPSLRDARIFEELAARLLLEQAGDETAREGLSFHTLTALAARLSSVVGLDGSRLEHLAGLSAIERGRADFFAGLRPAGAFDGRLQQPLPIDALPGSLARPLSASTLGRYAECPQRFFLESVLRLRPLDEMGDDLDERAVGSLAHAALERLFSAWRAAQLFPLRGRAEEQALIAPAAEAAAAAFRAKEPSGHDVLFRGRLRALIRMLEAIWQKEISDPPAAGFQPQGFEHAFSGLSLSMDDATPVHLTGSIDRLDVHDDGEQIAVFDYKSGRLRELTPDLKPEAFGETSWQLPLYAAAMRQTRGVREVSMNYYSLRDVKVSGVLAPAWLVLDAGSEEAPTLGGRLRTLVAQMRQGRFDVEPREGACDHCRMQAACRVRLRRDENDNEAGP